MWQYAVGAGALCLVAAVAATPGVRADDGEGWKTYAAQEYGFTMLVPEGATIEEKESGDWGGLYGDYEGVKLWGLAKKGEKATPEEIERFGVKLTGIKAKYWKQIDKGEGDGWEWYRTVKAESGDTVVFGGYGVGPKGSYLLILKTTKSDFDAHEADYKEWYESITLN